MPEVAVAQRIAAKWTDTRRNERAGVVTATMAVVLNGLGFSNRWLYVVPLIVASNLVAHLLKAGERAEDANEHVRLLTATPTDTVARLLAPGSGTAPKRRPLIATGAGGDR